MDLVKVDDSSEDAFVTSHLTGDAFIGLNDVNAEGHWKWAADGQLTWCGGADGKATSDAANTFSYVHWASGQPTSTTCEAATFGGHRYWFCQTPQTFDQAEAACASAGMDLVRVDGAAENQFLGTHPMAQAWLGATDRDVVGEWRWLQGDAEFWSGGQGGRSTAGAYGNWGSGNPRGTNSAQCLALHNGTNSYWYSSKCDQTLGFICEGPSATSQQLPDAHDCAVTTADGWVATQCNAQHGFVCETTDPADKLTFNDIADDIRDDYRTGHSRVSVARFRSNVPVVKPFVRYGDRLGLRECVDTLKPYGPLRTASYLSQEAQDYRQYYKGVPVYARGYVVHTNPQTGKWAALTGTLDPTINVDTTPTVSESAAFRIAVDGIGAKRSDYQAQRPHGTLFIYPGTQGPHPDWQLVWMFALPRTKNLRPYEVVVSAASSRVIYTTDHRQQAVNCENLDVTAAPYTPTSVATLQVEAFQQKLPYFGDPDIAQTTSLNQTPPKSLTGATWAPFALYTNSPLGTGLPATRLYAHCVYPSTPEQYYPEVAKVRANPVDVGDPLISENDEAAADYMATQRCLEYFYEHFQTGSPPGKGWIGVDGDGKVDIPIAIASSGPYAQFIGDPIHPEVYYNVEDSHPIGASIETSCHELTHFLQFVAQGYVPSNGTAESAAISEGIGDAIGSAVEIGYRLTSFPDAWCFAGDEYYDPNSSTPTPCQRNLANPPQSSSIFCRITRTSGGQYGGCPANYGGANYNTFPNQCQPLGNGVYQTSDCSDAHSNGTVLGHWFYLIAHGGVGTNANSCPYHVYPLDDADPGQSVIDAARVLKNALTEQYYAAGGSYYDIANATIQAAHYLPLGLSQAQIATVVDAWFAVNVIPDYKSAWEPYLTPKRDAGPVYPWVTFTWPHFGSDPQTTETSWDFQIGEGSFDPTSLDYQNDYKDDTSAIKTHMTKNGQDVGYLKLAVPFDSQKTYWWRVRPHSTADWTDCYPIHWFNGTTHPDPVTNITVGPVDSAGTVKLGDNVTASWSTVKGAESYDIYVATGSDPKCQAASGVLQFFAQQQTQDPQTANISAGLQPLTTYYIDIQPVGPEDFKQKPSYGKCVTATFKTGAMPVPTLFETSVNENPPKEVTDFPYEGTVRPLQSISDTATTAQFVVNYYEADRNWQCTTQLGAPPRTVDAVTAGADSYGTIDDFYKSPPNPTGYCWTATAIASNGVQSKESPPLLFTYSLEAVGKLTGAAGGLVDMRLDPGVLGGDGANTYDKPVTLKWDPYPDPNVSVAYEVKLGRYPWNVPISPRDPINCVWPISPTFSTCDDEPQEVKKETTVAGTELPLPAGVAGEGRYAWTVWPVLVGPDGNALARQPLVDPSIENDYTTGPSPAQTSFDDLAAVKALSTNVGDASITGHIHFDYIPDGQVEIDGSPNNVDAASLTVGPLCPPAASSLRYADRYNCDVPFKIEHPEQDTHYKLEVRAYNAASGYPNAPVVDKSTLVYDRILWELTTAKCGSLGDVCCSGTFWTGNGGCDSGQCVGGRCGCEAPTLTGPPYVPAGPGPLFDYQNLVDTYGDPIHLPCPWRLDWTAVPGATYEVDFFVMDLSPDGNGGWQLLDIAQDHVKHDTDKNYYYVQPCNANAQIPQLIMWQVAAVSSACGTVWSDWAYVVAY